MKKSTKLSAPIFFIGHWQMPSITREF